MEDKLRKVKGGRGGGSIRTGGDIETAKTWATAGGGGGENRRGSWGNCWDGRNAKERKNKVKRVKGTNKFLERELAEIKREGEEASDQRIKR